MCTLTNIGSTHNRKRSSNLKLDLHKKLEYDGEFIIVNDGVHKLYGLCCEQVPTLSCATKGNNSALDMVVGLIVKTNKL